MPATYAPALRAEFEAARARVDHLIAVLNAAENRYELALLADEAPGAGHAEAAALEAADADAAAANADLNRALRRESGLHVQLQLADGTDAVCLCGHDAADHDPETGLAYGRALCGGYTVRG